MDIPSYFAGSIAGGIMGAMVLLIVAVLSRRLRHKSRGPSPLVRRRYRRYQHSRRFNDSTSLWRGHLPDTVSKNVHEDIQNRLGRINLIYTFSLGLGVGLLLGLMMLAVSSPRFLLYIALIVLIVEVPLAIFSLWFPHKTFFSTISLKTDIKKINWTKYYVTGRFRDMLETTIPVSLPLMSLFYGLIGVPVLYFGNGGHIPNECFILLAMQITALVIIFSLIYAMTFWRLITASQSLDEYHPTLADWITDDTGHDNMIKAPMRCNKDDTHNICLKIKPRSNRDDGHESDYLEAELQAVGVKVMVEKLTQRKSLVSPDFLFFWNCNFDTPGTHLINLLLRVTTKEGDVKQELLRKSHEILVTTPYRKYWPALVTSIVTALTFVFSLRAYMGLTW